MIGQSSIRPKAPKPAELADQRTAQALLDSCASLAACPGWTNMLLPQIAGEIRELTARILDEVNIGPDDLRDLRNQRWALKRQLDRLQAAQQQARALLDKTPAVDTPGTAVPHSDAPLPEYFAEAIGAKPASPSPADILKEAAQEFNPFPTRTP